jgi:hypothetical protein
MTKDAIRNFFATDGVPLGLKSDTKDKLVAAALEVMKHDPQRLVKLQHHRFKLNGRVSARSSYILR